MTPKTINASKFKDWTPYTPEEFEVLLGGDETDPLNGMLLCRIGKPVPEAAGAVRPNHQIDASLEQCF